MKHRSKMAISQEFASLVKFIRKSKRVGVTWTEMTKHILGYQLAESNTPDPYNDEWYIPKCDRGLLTVHMKRLKDLGIRKTSINRKRYYDYVRWDCKKATK